MTQANPVQSIRYTLVPPTTALSGNTTFVFSTWGVTGRILGVEVGSSGFTAATGSLYIVASGNTFSQNRTVAIVNGIAQVRTFYPLKEFSRSANQGTLLSGVAYSDVEHPLVDGDAIGLASSGTFGGTGLFILYYQ